MTALVSLSTWSFWKLTRCWARWLLPRFWHHPQRSWSSWCSPRSRDRRGCCTGLSPPWSLRDWRAERSCCGRSLCVWPPVNQDKKTYVKTLCGTMHLGNLLFNLCNKKTHWLEHANTCCTHNHWCLQMNSYFEVFWTAKCAFASIINQKHLVYDCYIRLGHNQPPFFCCF